MKIKRKPTKPKRKTLKFTESFYLSSYEPLTMEHMFNKIKEQAGPDTKLSDVTCQEVCSGYDYEAAEVYLRCERLQTDEEYQVSIDEYKKKKKEYDAWFKDNEAEIEKELTARKKRERTQAQRRKDQLLKSRAKIDEELEKLK